MAAGKLQIISSILKLDKQFRATHIVDVTGLDRNLVRYHLMSFVEKGYLEKFDKYYVIKSKEGLLDSMVETSEKLETALPQPGGFLINLSGINLMAETTVAARILELPMAEAHRELLIKKCDDTVRVMKQLRKYLTNATKTEGSARKFFSKTIQEPEQIEAVWKWFVGASQDELAVDLDEFEKAYKEAMVEDE